MIDVLRGFAVLGILTMNITLGQPGATRLNPTIAGGFEGTDFVAWVIGYFLFDEKMITMFSMLFGAGVVLFADRLERRGVQPRRLYYRRSLILLAIGLLHAYLLWEGDILVTYSICGMIVYPLRHKPPKQLVAIGALLWLISLPLTLGFAGVLREARQTRSPLWTEIQRSFQPDELEIKHEIENVRRAGFVDLVRKRAPAAVDVQTRLLFLSFLWTVSGRMLFGMALLKIGFFTAARDRRFYLRTMFIGYGIGWPVVGIACAGLLQHQFDPLYLFGAALPANSAASVLVAIGHASVLMLIYQAGFLPGLMRRLAAVGRMALTNYLTQTVIATTLFYGYGFAQFGAFSRVQLYGIVFAIWVAQLWYSPAWLARFGFGPAEWAWRSLTYGKAQRLIV